MPFSLRAVGGVRFVQRRQGLQRFAAPHSRCLDSSSILLCFDRSVEVTSSLHPRTGSIPRDGTVYRGHATKATFFSVLFPIPSYILLYNTINSVPSLLPFLFPSDYPGHFLSFFFFMSSALLAAASFAFTLSLSLFYTLLPVSLLL